ncbi:5-formyltetrahydrofolate cyclo-ligase [Algoriphagus hitonicola]|uniref:5-formyltetrahydrofolate cyclo-ligase n=1 Tax=Algoriphagus hitonicola TaxID=435880 RepID=A0A1I2UTP2_9BACT|nr:5-formyltetrahydrofolate cyclo-ligase [Algoriphagus hitonicola]SFG79619.1 5-formyltetrahydrofolate cyclo-ligase [Algoriphagus hitonicola]
MDKSEIRKKYILKRANLSDQERSALDKSIQKKVFDFLQERPQLQGIHLFLPIARQHEIDTLPILQSLWEKERMVFTSKVKRGSLEMDVLTIPRGVKMIPDHWGIPIPETFDVVGLEAIDLVFVPLLAYDSEGGRIGFGKGYYDVFLAKLRPNVLKVGLSFFPPEERLPKESHDISLDYCICPEKVFTF